MAGIPTFDAALILLCLVVSCCQAQQALWPPECCLEKTFTMTYRGIYGDIGPGTSWGLSNLALMAFDFDAQISASEGVEKGYDGSPITYHVIQDYKKESIWTIMEGLCQWSKMDQIMGTGCIGSSSESTSFYGSLNYMGYIPTYTWKTLVWGEYQKGFSYMSVTENECLPVMANFAGYNDHVLPTPETLFNGGNFYNYTSGISHSNRARLFTVPDRCPPAPPPDNMAKDYVISEEDKRDGKHGNTFALTQLLMKMHRLH